MKRPNPDNYSDPYTEPTGPSKMKRPSPDNYSDPYTEPTGPYKMKRQIKGLADSRWSSTRRRRNSFHGSDLSPMPTAWPRSFSARTSPAPTATTTMSLDSAGHPASGGHRAVAGGADALAGGKTLSAPQELMRYAKIVRRLKWKLPYLATGYNMATSPEGSREARAEAELMFKLDFFEYYMLLERALVHLLGVFGVTISAGLTGVGARQQNGAEAGRPATHQYHHNVLAALGAEDNPLHAILGTGAARTSLARAKDLRNRWKNADGEDSGRPAAQGAGTMPLRNYDLENMLQTIFDGFDAGFHVAELRVADLQLAAEASGMRISGPAAADDEQWDFMVDAMDWEAV